MHSKDAQATGTKAHITTTLLGYLERLVALTGPSGSEEDVARLVLQLARPLADRVKVDAFGNVFATRHASGSGARRVVIAAHMDEVGFRVRTIEADGFLRLEKVGGTDDRVLPAQRVWVRTESARLLGVIGAKSAHLLTDADRQRVTPYEELYVDVGARTAEDVTRMGVRLGDPVGFVGDLTELGQGTGRYTAHAIDDRAGCAVLLALLETFRDEAPPVTLTVVFSTQEEVGLRGAQAAASQLDVDVALALDMTAADDTPDTTARVKGRHLQLGAGPAVKVMDFSTLAHPAVRRGLLAAANAAGIEVQHELLKGIGTDAGALQHASHGVPTGTVSVANRYTHTAVEVVDLADLEGALQVLLAFVRQLPGMDLQFISVEDA
ncbi:M42 family metallopeptidase [Deinococcus apachensis]|uniref:M42 family metallopeptidase n=1 Tax=Deinococcus apachensis TaxID=309886 RepID=UPI00036FFC32|nr:M42 family metallopeptidase [Deinococcus apachensis]